MESFKRKLKLLGLVVLIVLASFGVGIGGGVPVPSSNKKDEIIEVNADLLESKQGKTDIQLDINENK